MNILMLSTYPPRKCGIGEFAADLTRHLLGKPGTSVGIAAIVTEPLSYPPEVVFTVRRDYREDYVHAAYAINASRWDAVVVQHEFGLFGGEDGNWILDFLDHLRKPVVTVLHTLDGEPVGPRASIVNRIAAISNYVIATTQHAKALLPAFGSPPERTIHIPLGAPDNASLDRDALRAAYGVGSRVVALTFGLLNPNKGIDLVLSAMPSVVAEHPETLYWIVGSPHPDNPSAEGYADGLRSRVSELGLAGHVQFIPEFQSRRQLLERLTAADVYVNPHWDVNFVFASGTLSHAARTGKPILSTPTSYAKELLEDGTGLLFPFGDAGALSAELSGLIGSGAARSRLAERARSKGTLFEWSRVADGYLQLASLASAEGVRRGWADPPPQSGGAGRSLRGKRGGGRRRRGKRGRGVRVRGERRLRRLRARGGGRRRLRLRRVIARRSGARARRSARRKAGAAFRRARTIAGRAKKRK